MPGVNVTVSLSEVLEVRGAPLTETEIWTLLCLGAEALQDIFITGRFYPRVLPSPRQRYGPYCA